MASHSPKAIFREDNGSHDGLGFNNTIPIVKSNLLEHLGHTKAKARRQTWTSKPGDNQSPRSFFGTHSQEHSTVVKRREGIVSGSIDTPLVSRGVPRTTREGHSDCGSAGSRIGGQLGGQTLHSKDPNAARQDHHWKAVDEATTGAPHHYGDRWVPK